MNITVEKQPNCGALLRVEVPSDTIDSEREQIVSAFSSQAKIQGFRPGKVPRHVVEKRFASAIKEELEARLAKQAYRDALKNHELKVLDVGEPEDYSETPDGSVTFRLDLTLAPDIDLPDYKGLTLQHVSAEVTEDDIAQNLDQLRNRMADYEPIEDRPAEEGDLAVIDFIGTVDGKPIEEVVGKPVGYLAGREDHWIKIDEESFLPGFATQLIGAKPGDQLQIRVTIPEDFPVDELHGVAADFQVTVKELKSVNLPELDDEFAGKLTGGKSRDELREMIRQQLETEKRRRSDDAKVNQIIEHFNGAVDFELPEDLLRQETQNQADELVQEGVKSGMSEEDIASRQDEIFATAGFKARNNLKTNFILQEIARLEGLEINDHELASHLTQVAQSRKENPKTFIKNLQRENRLPGIRNSMLVGKAIDFILEHATVEGDPEEEPTTEQP
jgi:trigger factor